MKTVVLVALFACVAFGRADAQDEVLAGSKEFIHRFDEAEAVALSSFIEKIAGPSRIVGLGEVSHYTRECYLLKHQIIQALIEKGYRGLILEVDFGQALIWDDYVVNGVGDIDAIVASSGWFTYRTQEFKDLLVFLRLHNQSAEAPFRVFGMEMTATNYNLTWLKNYLADSGLECQPLLKILGEERKSVAFQEHSPGEVQEYWRVFYSVSKYLQENEKKLKGKSESEFAVASRLAEIMRQYATYVAQEELGLKHELRDQFSSRNVVWCLDQLGENSKVVIWAHNGHVTKDNRQGITHNVRGHNLHRWFGKEYFSIGFTFNEGEFGSFGSNGFQKWNIEADSQPSFTKQLTGFGSPYLIVDIRGLLDHEKSTEIPLRKPCRIRRDISESYNASWPNLMTINLSQSYDALIFFDKSSYPTTIPWQQ